jgi:fibronectin type 3 domain-containing protein
VAPVDTLVWVLVGIFSLNLFAVGWLVTLELVERHRLDKEIKEVDALWRSLTTPLSAAAVLGGGGRGRFGGRHRAPSIHKLPTPPRQMGKASMGLAVAATAVWVVAAVLGPADRRTITAAEGVVDQASATQPAAPSRTPLSSRAGTEETAGTGVFTRVPTNESPNVSIATSEDEAVPATVAAQPHSSSAIYLDWAGVTTATGYAVERREEDTRQRFLQIVTVQESVTAYTDMGLDSDTTYFYRVSALTEEGTAPPSDVVSATTSISPPAAPDVAAVATMDTIALTWADVADETGYRIERSPDGATDWMEIGTNGQDVTAYVDVSLTPGTTYHYRIVATNAGGDSAPSNVVSATTVPNVEEPPNEEESPVGGAEGIVEDIAEGTAQGTTENAVQGTAEISAPLNDPLAPEASASPALTP